MDIDSFNINIKIENFYEDISNDVEKRFDTSNYKIKRPLPIGKNKKVIGLMRDELRVKIATEFEAVRPKTFSYLVDDGNSDKKAKKTKKCVIKLRLTFTDYKDCLINMKSYWNHNKDLKVRHILYTQEINSLVLSSNDD